jgi:hypothetical protein
MRRHHQEVHMIDNLAIVQMAAIVAGRAAELAEHILPVFIAPPFLNLRTKIVYQIFAARDAPAHGGEGEPAHARIADRSLHHIDKGLVDRSASGPSGTPRKALAATSKVICLIAG